MMKRPSTSGSHASGGFTLTELLAAIAIIVVIAGVTVVSVRNVAREARVSSATNAVVAALDHGRALAIREETVVAVVFRPRLVNDRRQQVDIITARWSGQTPIVNVNNANNPRAIDRFVPMPGVAPRRLPAGIGVTGPLFHSGGDGVGEHGLYWDETWGLMSHLPTVTPAGSSAGEPAGRIYGIMFGPDGSVLLRNPRSFAWRMFVDFNNDQLQQVSGCTVCTANGQQGVLDYTDPPGFIPNPFPGGMFNVAMMFQYRDTDEPFITLVPFLSVYDMDAFRDQYEPNDWLGDNWQLKHRQLTEFVNESAERLHFNRHTGVVMR
jgi:prepilin-type N-terminal cleavage/methylation domain-containing protein